MSILNQANDFWQKVAIAVVSAVLAFVSGYSLYRIQERRKGQNQQLSYQIAAERALVPYNLPENIRENTEIRFSGIKVDNLYELVCSLRNTGNAVVRKQEIRLSFKAADKLTAKILAFSIEPEPEAEFGFALIPDGVDEETDRRFIIRHFPVGRELAFRFIVTGELPRLKLFDKNDEFDVSVREQSGREIEEDEDVIRRFLLPLALYFTVPPIFQNLGVNFAADGMRLVLLLLLLPLLGRAAAIFSRLLIQNTKRRVASLDVTGATGIILSEVAANNISIDNVSAVSESGSTAEQVER